MGECGHDKCYMRAVTAGWDAIAGQAVVCGPDDLALVLG